MLRKDLLKERKLGVERAKDVLELIHTDICGPFPTASWNGQQYVITFIDDYSRYECGIVSQYTMPSKPNMNGMAERRNRTLKDMVPTKVVNKTPYELWTGKKPSINHFHIWGCSTETQPYRPHERKLDSRIVSCYFVGYVERSWGYKFYDPTSRSFFETRNARILEEVEFGKEENMRNVVFEEECVNDIGQVLVPITVQETTPIIGDNVQTTLPHIVPKQDYDEALPQPPIEQPQQPQQVSLRRSIKERRHAIPDDYIVFLQEHKDSIGLTKDYPINFYQVMQSSYSQKCIYAMKDELKSTQDNNVWDLVKLLEGVKPIGCKWIFTTKKDSKGNIKRYKARLVAKGFTQKEGIDYKETFSPVPSKDSFRTVMTLVAHFDLELHQMDVKTILRDRSQGILRLLQENYISKVLERFNMKHSKPGDTLIAKGDKFSLKQCPNNDLEGNEMQKILYASVMGNLMYAQFCTRPDIAFVVGVLGRFFDEHTAHIDIIPKDTLVQWEPK
ncbi:hypothetical protein CR513_16005, partial [Mucuna pruriens]